MPDMAAMRHVGLAVAVADAAPEIREVADLVKDGTISKGMIPKTDSAVTALRNGVHRVHFVDGENPHSLLLEIFTDKGVGTEIVNA